MHYIIENFVMEFEEFKNVSEHPEITREFTDENLARTAFKNAFGTETGFNFKDGKISLRDIDLNGLKDEFTSDKIPDYETALRKCGFSDEEIKSEKTQNAIKQMKVDYATKFEDTIDVNKREVEGRKLDQKYKSPENEMEIKKLEKLNKEMSDKLDEYIKKNEKAGSFVKDSLKNILKIGALIGIGDFLYQGIVAHQEQCNGCWKISLSDPKNRVKISNLTCSTNARAATSGFTLATPCESSNNKDCGIKFNPCIDSSSDKNFYNVCVWTQDNNDYCDKTTSKFLGPGTDGVQCKTKIADSDPSCPSTTDSDWCSPNCNCDHSDNCKNGYTVQCVNLGFWASLADLVNEPVSAIEDTLKDVGTIILTILKYAAIGIVVLFVIFIFYKVISSFISEKKDQSNNNDNSIKPHVNTIIDTSSKNNNNRTLEIK
jgi:hypothetical protein